jgi:hypothetical protein
VAIHNVDERGEVGKGGNLTCYPTWPGAGRCGGGAESWGGAAKSTSSAVCKQSGYHQPSLDMCGGGTAPGDPKPTPYTYLLRITFV